MKEMIDILNENTAKITGKIVSKDEAHRKGICHGTIYILIVNTARTKTLLQKRSLKKQLYPNKWDIAVGGHINAGEEILGSAQREFEEELGLNPNDFKFEFVDIIKEDFEDNGFISNVFTFLYIIYSNIDISKMKLQIDEVSEIKWCTKSELNELIESNNIIPHVKIYEILNKILR